jgi:EpsI family protein
MNVRRLIFLQLFLIAGFGTVFLLPKQSHSQPTGVTLELPDFIQNWFGVPQAITQNEITDLGADTEFARRIYSNGLGDHVLASIVLAGADPDTSLHRPERCLPAQGWTMMDSKVITIRDPRLPNGELKVTRLHSQQKFPDSKGNLHTLYNVNYYWFIGVNEITESAIRRALIDIRDRVVKGYDQRWAYVTVASNITQGVQKFGRSEAETDEILQKFIANLFPVIVKPDVKVANK